MPVIRHRKLVLTNDVTVVACLDVGFVCWSLDLVGWTATRRLYLAFRLVVQSHWTTRVVASLGDVLADW